MASTKSARCGVCDFTAINMTKLTQISAEHDGEYVSLVQLLCFTKILCFMEGLQRQRQFHNPRH